MPSSTSSSDPERRARSFLVGCAAGLLAVEALFVFALPVDRGRHEVDRVAASALHGKPRGDAVVLGDSVTYGVLLGVDEGIADLTSNQKIGVPGNVFLLRRYLENAEEPAGVVVYTVLPSSLSEELSPRSPYLEPYFTSVFTRDEEIADVEAFGRDDLAAAMRTERAARRWNFPSYLRRGAVTDPLGTWLRGLKRRGGGASDALPAELPMSAKRKIRERQAIRRFRTSPETDAYLERLAELTQEAGAVLALTPPPIAPSIRESWHASGYLDAYEEYVETLASRHTHVIFRPECPYEPEDDRRFVDGVHLDPAGKEAYAEALVAWIAELGGS